MKINKILYVTHGDINYMIDENMYETLLAMGYNVVYYDYVKKEKQIGKDAMNKELIWMCKYENPDLMFMILYTDQVKFETIDVCRNYTYVMNWFCDDQWRYHDFGEQSTKNWIKHLDYAVTVAPEALEWYKNDGFDNVILSNWAINPKYYYPMDLEKIYDVSFIGQKYGNREAIINEIKKAGINIYCFGRNWESGYVSFTDMIKIFNQSHICLNISDCSKGENKQSKGKVFEIACTGGGVLLTDAFNEIEQYFDKTEYCEYANTGQAIMHIKLLLSDKDKILEISNRARQRVLNEHTYERRFEKIFQRIEDETK